LTQYFALNYSALMLTSTAWGPKNI
jgi:hypothetical protein